jgi:hypothetical protein
MSDHTDKLTNILADAAVNIFMNLEETSQQRFFEPAPSAEQIIQWGYARMASPPSSKKVNIFLEFKYRHIVQVALERAAVWYERFTEFSEQTNQTAESIEKSRAMDTNNQFEQALLDAELQCGAFVNEYRGYVNEFLGPGGYSMLASLSCNPTELLKLIPEKIDDLKLELQRDEFSVLRDSVRIFYEERRRIPEVSKTALVFSRDLCYILGGVSILLENPSLYDTIAQNS